MVRQAEELQGAPGVRYLHLVGTSCSCKRLARIQSLSSSSVRSRKPKYEHLPFREVSAPRKVRFSSLLRKALDLVKPHVLP